MLEAITAAGAASGADPANRSAMVTFWVTPEDVQAIRSVSVEHLGSLLGEVTVMLAPHRTAPMARMARVSKIFLVISSLQKNYLSSFFNRLGRMTAQQFKRIAANPSPFPKMILSSCSPCLYNITEDEIISMFLHFFRTSRSGGFSRP
jgi:hypothetical protein